MARNKTVNPRLQGTIYLLILETLAQFGPLHGGAITQNIRREAGEILLMYGSSLRVQLCIR